MANVKMEISKTINGKRHNAGTVEHYLPTLDAFGLASPDSFDAAGLPVYGDDVLAFLQDALTSKVQGIIRNIAKVEGETVGSLTIVPTRDYPASLAELVEGSQGARFFEVRKLAVDAFAGYVAKLEGVQDKAKAYLVSLFGEPRAVQALASKVKARFGEHLAAFRAGLTDEQVAGMASYLKSLDAAVQSDMTELASF
jgi:hypothetical protein